MRRYFIKAIGMAACISFLGSQAMAQQTTDKNKLSENDEIIIRKKGDKDSKVTVEIKDGEVKINGKALSEFDDDNVSIRRRGADAYGRAFVAPRSPFQGGTWNYNDDGARNMRLNTNRAVLGVVTEKDDNGAKINNVTKGSAAEKAGLKEGDVITKVDDTKIETPEDLSKTIGKYKPEDKAAITYMRDKKEQKANVVLNKRTGGTTYFPENFDFNKNFNFDFNGPQLDGLSMLRSGSPRLGIKAQDTEDGKGVKVLDVDDESNAAKAGIKEGDILTEFDGKAVNSATELMEAAKNAKDKNNIKLKLIRNGKSQEVEVKIPKKLKTANL